MPLWMKRLRTLCWHDRRHHLVIGIERGDEQLVHEGIDALEQSDAFRIALCLGAVGMIGGIDNRPPEKEKRACQFAGRQVGIRQFAPVLVCQRSTFGEKVFRVFAAADELQQQAQQTLPQFPLFGALRVAQAQVPTRALHGLGVHLRADLLQRLIGSHRERAGLIVGATLVQKVTQFAHLEAAVSARRAKGADEARVHPCAQRHGVNAEQATGFGQSYPFGGGFGHVETSEADRKYEIYGKTIESLASMQEFVNFRFGWGVTVSRT